MYNITVASVHYYLHSFQNFVQVPELEWIHDFVFLCSRMILEGIEWKRLYLNLLIFCNPTCYKCLNAKTFRYKTIFCGQLSDHVIVAALDVCYEDHLGERWISITRYEMLQVKTNVTYPFNINFDCTQCERCKVWSHNNQVPFSLPSRRI